MSNPFELPEDSAAPATVEQNPFVLPEDNAGRLRLSLDIASQSNPEQSALAQHIARTQNIPLGVVERNLPEFQRRTKLSEIDPAALNANAPATARFLSDVNAAKVAHDDVQQLAELEALMRQSSFRNAPRALYDTAGDVSISALKGAIGLPQAVVGLADIPTFGRVGKVLESIGYRPAEAQKILESAFSPEMQASLARVQNADGFLETLGTVLSEPQALSNTIIESLPLMLGSAGIARGVTSGAARLLGLEVTPLAAAAIGEGAIGAGAQAEQTRGETEDGLLTGKQSAAALASGVGTGLLGALGGKVAQRLGLGDIDTALAAGTLTGTPKAGFAKQVIGSGVSEGVFEELPQSAQEQMWQNFALDRPILQGVANAAAVGLVAGAVTGGAFGTYNATVAKLIERTADAQAQVDQALSDAQRLQAAMGAAAQSQLRERAPETFQQLVEQMSDGQSIYIDAQVLAQSGVDIAQTFPSLADQVNEAAFLNSTVEIPLAEALTAVPGTPLEELFLQNAKSSPDALSQAEVQQAGEQGQQLIQEEAERVLQQAQDQSAWQAKVDTVQQTIKDQLDQAGRFTSDVNDAYARLQSQFFSVMASRFGITPTEMYQRFSVKVAGQMGQGEVLNAGGVTLQDVTAQWDAAGIRSALSEKNGLITLSQIVVPQDQREQGVGTSAMQALIDYADRTGQRIALSPSADFGGNKKRLMEFYKRFGFVENKGRNKDFAVSETMIREPAPGFSQSRDVTQTPEFKNWFGDSKVVDAEGRPLVVYHGTTGDISEFDASRRGENTGAESASMGFFFTDDTVSAESYANYAATNGRVLALVREAEKAEAKGDWDTYDAKVQEYEALDASFNDPQNRLAGQNVVPVYLAMKNPLRVDAKGENAVGFDIAAAVKQAIRGKYDGLIIENLDDAVGLVDRVATHYVAFNPTQIKSATGNQGTFDPNDPNILRQSATLRRGTETLKKYGLKPGGKYKTRDVAAALESRQRAKYGTIAPDDRSPEAIANIAKWMTAEVEFEMDNPEKSGVGWYSEKFQRALDVMGNVFPELKTDKTARNVMTALIAITSDGQKVVPNFAQAMDIYGNYRDTGKFTTTRGHARQASINANLEVIQRLHDTMGAEAMHQYLMQEKTISELKKLAKENGGELKSDYQAHIKMPMAAVEFGPKLGAFYANLMGAHGYLTMDRWWSRTFNRYRGTLLQSNTQSALDTFKSLIGKPELSNDEVLAAVVAPREALEARGFKTRLALLVGQSEPGKAKAKAAWMAKARELAGDQFDAMLSEHNIERAANTIYKTAFENLEDAPFNATDRTFMLNAVNKAQQTLKRKGYNLSVADIQAILWYYEKRLYGELGARQTADISYEEAAQRVASSYASGSGIESLLDDTGAAREDGGTDEGGVPVGEDDFTEGADGDVLEQQARGTFNPQTLLISLGPQSDLSTFLHESGHFFLEVMADLAALPDAPAQVREDMDKVLGWFGVPDLATWRGYTLEQKRPHHERWAESFEQYLLEGKAPSAELQPLFRRFRSWLVNVYKSLTDFMRGRNLEVNDEIRQVFDRMLATDAEIAQAEEQAGLLPDFDATNEAIERLQERSLRNLKWTLNARSKFLKQFTKEAKELRKGVLAEVLAEFEQRPDAIASRAIRKVRNKDGAERDAKIAAIADATGYATVEEMMAAVQALGPVNDAVQAEVDRRMLERHGDLATDDAREQAANEAVHNEARARALAAELKSQDEAMNPRETTGRTDARGRPITVNALLEAARAFGADLAARRQVGQLKNAIYLHRAAEARAGKAWQTATKKGDSKAAVQAKRDQLLNNQAVRSLIDAQNEVRASIEFFRKVLKGNNEKLVKGGRDPDVVNAMRAILGAYGIAPRTAKGAMEYMELVQKNDPAMHSVIAPSVTMALNNAKPFNELSVEEVRGLTDELKSLWHLAKRSRQMEIDGDLLDLEDLADQLYTRMEEIGIPDVLPGETGALTDAEMRKRNWLQQAPALLRRVEQWAESKDGAFGGPFLKFIFQPVKIAADRYRADRLIYRQKFQALVDAIAPTMDKKVIAAPELGYTFGRGHNGIGLAELLHAILHTGNDSNKRKLLLGRNWATENPDGTLDTSRWDAFLQRMHDEGVLTKAHYDFAQGVWDLMEETKPLAQKTHRDVFGRYFAEVTANPVVTPFGTYRGGYVPAQADPLLVQEADQRELLETENAGMSYAFPATNKGFTKGRVEYNRPLKLDLRTLPQHIDKVLLFSHMEPAVRGVDRLLRRKKIAQTLNKIDPAAINGMLKPWLNRSARQTVETPVSADAGLNRMLSMARARTGMALMMGNISNTLQQITGFSTALLKVKGSHMRRAVAQYIADPTQLKNTVWALSPYMADRASNEVAVLSDTLDAIVLNPSVYQSAERFTRRHGYFLQTAMDNQMSPIIWTAAYNQALEEGMEDRMARRFADGVIRQTQGSTLPEDVSRIETGTAFARAFTQFVGYFNMLANTNATALQQIAQEQGLRKGAGKAFGVLMLGMMVPIWVAEVIAQAFRGGPPDDEDDGYLDDWLAAVFGFGTIRGILSGVPGIAQIGQSMVNRFNDNPADDKFSLSPTVSVLESAAAAPQSVYKLIADDGSAQKAVRDMSALITVTTGLPAMTLARPLGYAAGVAQGKIQPTDPVDFARGMVTGTASPESRTP